MLADEIASNSTLTRLYPGMDKIQQKIAVAQKFNLAVDFAVAADGLVDNLHELDRIAPFCRLPYSLSWFEWAQADRRHWMEAPLHYPGFQGAPHRVGFLTEAIGNDLAHWRTYLCWSLKGDPALMAFGTTTPGNRLNISPLNVIYDTKKPIVELADCISFDLAPFDLGLPEDMVEEYLLTLSRSDWAGEIRYLIALLGMLNARNVAETERVDFVKLNRSRAKQGKFPLSTHTVLKIRPAHKPSLLQQTGSARSGEIRAHFVRGHFKTRRSGIFWWGPHMRGRLERGYVSKDYEVM